MEEITREQMESEFGTPGVQNSKLLDLVTLNATSGKVSLVMFERRAWGESARQLQEIEEKINRYMAYALDGYLGEHYPQYLGKGVQICLECAEAPKGEAVPFLAAAKAAIEAEGLEFDVRVAPSPTSGS